MRGIIIGLLLAAILWAFALAPFIFLHLRMEKQSARIKHLENITTVLEPAREPGE